MKDDYQVDDDVWIFMRGHQGEKTRGKVIKVIDDLPGYTMKHYVIELETCIDPILECRSAITMSPDEEAPIGFWHLVRAQMKDAKTND